MSIFKAVNHWVGGSSPSRGAKKTKTFSSFTKSGLLALSQLKGHRLSYPFHINTCLLVSAINYFFSLQTNAKGKEDVFVAKMLLVQILLVA
jgi:hypothetical protein